MSAPAALAIAKLSIPETEVSQIKSQREIKIPSGYVQIISVYIKLKRFYLTFLDIARIFCQWQYLNMLQPKTLEFTVAWNVYCWLQHVI